MSRAAEDAVHMKAVLAADFQDPIYPELLGAWMESEANSEWGAAEFNVLDDPVSELAYMREVLDGSENFYVAPPMCRLAFEVAPDMPDEELRPYDVPSLRGWMWLGEPYRSIDIKRKTLSVNAIMWVVSGDKVKLWHFTHKSDPVDWVNLSLRNRYSEDLIRILPMLSVNHVFSMKFNELLPRGISWDTPVPWDARVEWVRKDNDDGTFTMTMVSDQPIEGLAAGEEIKYVRSPMSAFIVCLWRLCQQSIASRYEEEPPRAARRRMLRANVPVRPVSVINLRRFDQTAAHPDAHVEWQHHWVVRGHWRNQPYREVDESGEKVTVYRQIYINPYLKGDLTKPLLHRDKVNALVR